MMSGTLSVRPSIKQKTPIIEHPRHVFYDGSMSKSLAFIVFSCVLMCACSDHEALAKQWAHKLEIENAIIDCDPSWLECGCTVKFVDDSKKTKIIPIACCGSGCVIVRHHD